jgi:hypothetical protein
MRNVKSIMITGALVLIGVTVIVLRREQAVAHVARDAQGRYEIRLDTCELSFGGPCNFPTVPHRIQDADWIYTKTTNGVVQSDHLGLSHGKDPDDRWAQEALRGTVTFSAGHMKIAFEVPMFDENDNIVGYQQYEHNGDWRLEGQ